MSDTRNLDARTVADFGEEWARYDQSALSETESHALFDAYFRHFPWDRLPPAAEGFDAGCGSGRWARIAAPRVGRLHCVDASEKALAVARRNLDDRPNCVFHNASVGALPFDDACMDFGYSLGVLHHIPDTEAGLRECARPLRPGAPFAVYLYYAFDNRPAWFRSLWRTSDVLRRGISRLPERPKTAVTEVLAATVYWPLARIARLAERRGVDVANFPLTTYRNLSFYSMRTDARDRFGTRLEQRFTADQIRAMMQRAGFDDIVFNERESFWTAVGYKR